MAKASSKIQKKPTKGVGESTIPSNRKRASVDITLDGTTAANSTACVAVMTPDLKSPPPNRRRRSQPLHPHEEEAQPSTAAMNMSMPRGTISSSSTKPSTKHQSQTALAVSTNTGTGGNKPDKAYKGLRHFSLMVCKKVEEKGTTTYNEVADELVYAIMQEKRLIAENEGAENAMETDPDTDNALRNNSTNPTSSSSQSIAKAATKQKRDASISSQSSTIRDASTIPGGKTKQQYDEKNIRRRVYDALNVLMAMDIIVKDNKKKEITWKGLPATSTHDIEVLRREYHHRQTVLEQKRESLQELLVQQVCFRNLAQLNYQREMEQQQQLRNEKQAKETASRKAHPTKEPKDGEDIEMSYNKSSDKAKQQQSKYQKRKLYSSHVTEEEKRTDTSSSSSSSTSSNLTATATATEGIAGTPPPPPPPHRDNKIPLPFIIVNTSSSAVIQCNMSRDLTDVMFDFSMPFEINDDNTILKRLGLHRTNEQVLHEMLPDDLYNYCETYNLFRDVLSAQKRNQPSIMSFPHGGQFSPPHHHNNNNNTDNDNNNNNTTATNTININNVNNNNNNNFGTTATKWNASATTIGTENTKNNK